MKLRPYRSTIALAVAFRSRETASFAPRQSKLRIEAATFCSIRSTAIRLNLRLSPEEIAASLGPDRVIASKPFTWDEVKEIVTNGDPTMHSRSMEVQESYIFHSKKVREEWKSMNDYILHSKFGFEKKIDDSCGKFVSFPSLQQSKLEQRVEIRLLPNDYPYFVTPDIEHWCLWKLGGRVEQSEVEWAESELMDRESAKEIMSWVNPPHLQSVPDIDHAHLLCRQR